MKIRVRDQNRQQHEIYYEDIVSITGHPGSDFDSEGLLLELEVDTADKKDLSVLDADVPLLLFFYFHDNKSIEILASGKIQELEEVVDAYEEFYLGYIDNIRRGVDVSH